MACWLEFAKRTAWFGLLVVIGCGRTSGPLPRPIGSTGGGARSSPDAAIAEVASSTEAKPPVRDAASSTPDVSAPDVAMPAQDLASPAPDLALSGADVTSPPDLVPPPGPDVALDTRRSACGNGRVDPDESCDDGNTLDGDGCGSTCALECGWLLCWQPPEGWPVSICGNAILQGGEQCDDGNVTSGDGCSSACSVERGYVCPVPGRLCLRVTSVDGGSVDAGGAG